MIYYDSQLVTNSRPHKTWWNELCVNREHFHNVEDHFAQMHANQAALLPRDAWRDLDNVTKRVMRNDEGQAYMSDLMPLARAVNIGKLAHLYRVSDDKGSVTRSMSGQVPQDMDKAAYDFRGHPVPIFTTGYGREWREWNTLQSENFDALADDQEMHTAKIRRDMAQYVLDGDSTLTVQGYQALGIKNHTYTQQIDMGSGGSNIDLTASATTSDEIDQFIYQTVGTVLDDNHVGVGINMYVSPEIGRRFDLPYSGSSGFKGGSMREFIESSRRVNKVVVTFELTGNEWFGFVPNGEFIRPLIGMAAGTTAIPRTMPMSNYQFLIAGAMGLEIRADFDGRSGVIYASETT